MDSNKFDAIMWSFYATSTISPPSPIPTPLFPTLWISFTQYLANNAQTQLNHMANINLKLWARQRKKIMYSSILGHN